MPKLQIIFLSMIAAVAFIVAAPAMADPTEDLQDRIDQHDKQIATMDAYCTRLRGILRHAGYPSDELASEMSFEQKLNRAIPNVHCDGTRLSDALTALSNAAQIEIAVDWKSLAVDGINQNTPIHCDARNYRTLSALSEILNSTGATAAILESVCENEKVLVTTQSEASRHVFVRTFDISHVLPRNPDLLMSVVVDTVAPDTWRDAGGTVGSIRIVGNEMYVTQTTANLQAIADFLEKIDGRKRITRQRAILHRQQVQIVAIQTQTDRLVARCRSLGIEVPPTLDQAMDKVLPNAQFLRTKFATCVDWLHSQSGQSIDVHWKALENSGIDGTVPITLNLQHQTLSEAVKLLVEKASQGNILLGSLVEANAITISTLEEINKDTVTRVYDVRGDVPMRGATRAEAIENLIRSITDTISPDSWRDAGGTIGSIRELQGQLIVTQTEKNQRQVRQFLDQLRNQGKAAPE